MSDDGRILEEGATSGMYRHNVVDLDGVRVAVGWRKRTAKVCGHKRLVYGATERLIECADCQQPVDAFDAFMVLTKHFEGMLSEARSRQFRADEALAATVHLRAAKEVERLWRRGMAPHCPTCRGGLLAEDFANGASATGADFIRAARKRAKEADPT